MEVVATDLVLVWGVGRTMQDVDVLFALCGFQMLLMLLTDGGRQAPKPSRVQVRVAGDRT
jgi:hypothetical protein